MNELQLANNSQFEAGVSMALGQHIDRLTQQAALEPEDLAALLQRARAFGAQIEDDPRVQALLQRFLGDFEQRKDQYADTTWRQLQYGWGKFAQWCSEQPCTALPATARAVEQYVEAMAAVHHRNSLSQLVWAIRTVHVKAGCTDPTATVTVKDRMKGVRRKKVEGGERVKQATPLRQADLDLLQVAWGEQPSAKAQRNWLTLNLAYETLLRKSELARIRVRDIEVMDDGSGVVTIPWTKTNQSGEPEMAPITPLVVDMVDGYLRKNGIEWDDDGYLLRPLTRYGTLQKRATTPLSKNALDLVFKEAWEVVAPRRPALRKLPPFSGHSCRVGAAQDLLSAGYSIPGIMQSGRWKSEMMVLRYCRKIMAQEGAMFRMRSGQR